MPDRALRSRAKVYVARAKAIVRQKALFPLLPTSAFSHIQQIEVRSSFQSQSYYYLSYSIDGGRLSFGQDRYNTADPLSSY